MINNIIVINIVIIINIIIIIIVININIIINIIIVTVTTTKKVILTFSQPGQLFGAIGTGALAGKFGRKVASLSHFITITIIFTRMY